MGSNDRRDDERPVHRVWVDAFEIGSWQVSNTEYDAFVRSAGYQPAPHRDDPRFSAPNQPVVGVSWFDAVHYCQWLSAISGRAFRLPTEAEWECAARGGAAGRLYPWGDEAPETSDSRWIDGPEERDDRAPNGFGLYDLCENVHEWCSDWYAADYYARSPDRNPRGPDTGLRRVSRGGSWRHQIRFTRCAARSSIPPDYHYNDYGFRIACDVT